MKDQFKCSPQPTDVNAINQVMEKLLSLERIGASERFIVSHSLVGYTYYEMANVSSYTSAYIKELGSQLWQDLSTTMGKRVTKKIYV